MMMYYVLGHSDPWPLLFVLAIIFLTSRRGRFGRGEEFRQRMAAFGERSKQWREEQRAEQRAFQDQVLAELRRQNEASEAQNALLRQLIEERTVPNPVSPE